MRFYSLLLHCYPSSYRAEYGDEMRTVFAQGLAAHPPTLGWLGCAAAAVADVLPNAAAIHMDVLRTDLHHARRRLARTPWLTLGAVLILALGVGANAAVFDILRAILLRPLPYRDANRVVMVWRAPRARRASQPASNPPGGSVRPPADPRELLTSGMVADVRGASRQGFSDLAALKTWQGSLEAAFDLPLNDQTERLRGAYVTPNFFHLLGARAASGRLFDESDENDAATPVVISDALWQRDFGGDPRIVGKPITMVAGRPRARTAFIVVGVLPPAFRFTYPQETEAWAMLPWSSIASANARVVDYRLVARLAPGVSVAGASARLRATRETAPSFWVEPIHDWVVGEARGELFLLGGVAVLLLLVTCTTVASIIAVRATARRTELALRAAIGADRSRLLRQLVTEGVALSAGGAALGVAFAILCAPVIRSLIPDTMPRGDEVSLDPRVLLVVTVASTLVTLAGTFAPLRRATKTDFATTMHGTRSPLRTRGARWNWQQSVIGAQSAITTALLISAALLMASFWRLGHMPLGFDGDRVLAVEMRLLDPKYRDSTRLAAFQADVLTGIRAIPGVREAGLTSAVPFRGVDFSYQFDRATTAGQLSAAGRFVDSSYFGVMRIPLVRGRLFGRYDDGSRPHVVVISESFAREMFGAADPIGQPIDSAAAKTVIGVVRDVRYAGFDREPKPAIYFPRSQFPNELVCIVARTTLPLAAAQREVSRVIHGVDPLVPAMNTTTIDRIVERSTAGRRFYTVATIAFSGLALALTIAGLAAIVSRSVVERRRELAIRSAIGAQSSALMAAVARDGMMPVAIGCLVGVFAAEFGTKLLAAFLFQTPSRDPIATILVPVGQVAIALLAAILAGRGVLRVAPMEVLRGD
jgi:putative ABC transport system permease protein